MMFAPLLLLAMTQTPLPAAADRGAVLYSKCLADVRLMDNPSDVKNLAAINECADYIHGFADALAVTDAPVCSGQSSLGTLVRVYVSYMQANPKMMDSNKVVGLMNALRIAYPCPAK